MVACAVRKQRNRAVCGTDFVGFLSGFTRFTLVLQGLDAFGRPDFLGGLLSDSVHEARAC